MVHYDRRSIALAVSLSALAGYVDALGFLSAGNFFISFMSGNSTRTGIAVGEGRFGAALLTSGVVALFVGGVILGSLLGHRADHRRRPAVLLLVALLLAVASGLYALGHPGLGIVALLLAMGAENAVFHREGEVSIGLTYMTGALVKLGQRLAAIAHGGPRRAWLPYALLWLGLVCGATMGSFAHARLAMQGLWFAALGALALAILSTQTRPH